MKKDAKEKLWILLETHLGFLEGLIQIFFIKGRNRIRVFYTREFFEQFYGQFELF